MFSVCGKQTDEHKKKGKSDVRDMNMWQAGRGAWFGFRACMWQVAQRKGEKIKSPSKQHNAIQKTVKSDACNLNMLQAWRGWIVVWAKGMCVAQRKGEKIKSRMNDKASSTTMRPKKTDYDRRIYWINKIDDY